MNYFNLLFCFLCFTILLWAPEDIAAQGDFFGGLQMNNDFYVRDPAIGASGSPNYDNLKSSTDAWFDLNYVNNKIGLDAGVRFDLFNNSYLQNPGTPYTAVGLGRFYIRKRINQFRITAGYIYDQFGSGIAFRAYEDRTLGIDNAILGVHVEYTPFKTVRIKAFTGLQKDLFSLYMPVIKGINGEYSYGGDKINCVTGASIVNRTLDQASMNQVVSAIESYEPSERFVPKYNTYVFDAYNTLNAGGLSWYVEGAYKTHEAINNANDTLINEPGSVAYSTLTYTTKGFGITGLFKRTQDFVFRVSPEQTLLNGMLSFIPPVTQQNSLRLPALYNAATQELQELAYSLDMTYTPAPTLSFALNGSEVSLFNNERLFQEVIGSFDWRINRKWQLLGGFQYVIYNQLFYEGDAYTPNKENVAAYTPFTELIWKINRKHSLRAELQYQYTKEDYGSWLYGLMEYSLAPWLSFAVSDMWNYAPNPERNPLANHYYSVYSAFTWKSNRFSLAYVRQVAGIVCTGGVCREEPAFSGVRMTLDTTF